MKVYILATRTRGRTVALGIYLNPALAKEAIPGPWRDVADKTPDSSSFRELDKSGGRRVCQIQSGMDEVTIYEFDLHVGDDPLDEFAAAVLSGDGPARDAVRDVLKS